MQDRKVPVRSATLVSQAPSPRGYWSRFGRIFGVLASVVAVGTGIAVAGTWGYNVIIDRGRGFEKAEQVVRDLAELKATKEQLAMVQRQNQQVHAELERLIKDKETLGRERDNLRIQLDAHQASVLDLTRQVAAGNNCSFVHRQIEAAQQAVDNHTPWITSSAGPSAEFLREHQILVDRLKEYQNQLGRCGGASEPVR